jgi:hypothetical protein
MGGRDGCACQLEAQRPGKKCMLCCIPSSPSLYSLGSSASPRTRSSCPPRATHADALVNCFRSVLALSPQDIVPAAYLASGRIAPDYAGLELNVGGGTVVSGGGRGEGFLP